MERSDVLKVMAMIRTYYPSNNQLPKTEQDINAHANAWYMAFKRANLSSGDLFDNMMDHVTTSKFPPTIADLCKTREVEKVRTTPNHEITRNKLLEQQKPEQTPELIKAREEALSKLNNLKQSVFKQTKEYTRGDD